MARAVRDELDRRPGRAPNPQICPFLRVEGARRSLLAPVQSAFGGNCCTAQDEPRPVGSLQQDLVCLSGSYEGCHRYVVGAAAVAKRLDPRRRRRVSASTRAAGVLFGAVAASVAGYALANAGTEPLTTAAAAHAEYAALERCPDTDGCYVWTVEAGQTLEGISARIGHSVEAVLTLNPGLRDTGTIRVGDRIRVPPPGV